MVMSAGAVGAVKIPLGHFAVSATRVLRSLQKALPVRISTNAKEVQEYASTTASTCGAAIGAVVSPGIGSMLTIDLALTSTSVPSSEKTISALVFATIHPVVTLVVVLMVIDSVAMPGLVKVNLNFYFKYF